MHEGRKALGHRPYLLSSVLHRDNVLSTGNAPSSALLSRISAGSGSPGAACAPFDHVQAERTVVHRDRDRHDRSRHGAPLHRHPDEHHSGQVRLPVLIRCPSRGRPCRMALMMFPRRRYTLALRLGVRFDRHHDLDIPPFWWGVAGPSLDPVAPLSVPHVGLGDHHRVSEHPREVQCVDGPLLHPIQAVISEADPGWQAGDLPDERLALRLRQRVFHAGDLMSPRSGDRKGIERLA